MNNGELSDVDKQVIYPLAHKYSGFINSFIDYNDIVQSAREIYLNIKDNYIPSKAKYTTYLYTYIDYRLYTLYYNIYNNANVTDYIEYDPASFSEFEDFNIYSIFKEALNKLSYFEQDLLRMLFYNDISVNDTAELYKLSAGRISQIKNKALLKLKYHLKKGGVNENNYFNYLSDI